MYRQHPAAAPGQCLAAQNLIADLDAQGTFWPEMLFERNNKIIWQRHLAQWHPAGLGFHFRGVDTALEVPDSVFSEGGEQLKHGCLSPEWEIVTE